MKRYLMLLVLMAVSLGVMTDAQAAFWKRDHHQSYPHYARYPYGNVSASLPKGFVEIGFSGSKYFYHTGIFYTQGHHREYVVIPPPQGVMVSAIPDGWNQVVIDGVVYYAYSGVYYSRVPQGYQVVQPPVQVIMEPVMVAATVVPQKMQEDFTINIPNTTGSGYASVVIKRSGTGFTGPQGEYYSEFPKVAQLQAMYGK